MFTYKNLLGGITLRVMPASGKPWLRCRCALMTSRRGESIRRLKLMLRSRARVPGLAPALFVAACATGGPSDDTKVEIIKPDGHDISPPLTELVKIPVFE